MPPAYRQVLRLLVLALAGPLALGIDVTAAYPAGDGGLFYAICEQLQRAHFAYPRTIEYNQFLLPFGYSPAAFYCVAAFASVAHVALGHAMNLWIAAWALAIGPAAYWTARQVLGSRVAAFAAATYVVLLPHYFNYLGMGGGLTRCPGFVLSTLACGAIWRLSAVWSRRSVALAAAASAACAWTHMEFFLLLTVSAFAIALAVRLPPRRALVVGAIVAALIAPWPALLWAHGTLASVIVALHTSHGTQTISPSSVSLTMFGDSSLFGLLGIVAAVVSVVRRHYVFLVWALLIALIDSRAGGQVTHLPIGLAFGESVAWVAAAARSAVQRRALAIVGVAIVAFGAFANIADARRDVRIRPGDVADMRWIATHTQARALIVVGSAEPDGAAFTDQTYEWLPVFAARRSPTTFEGLEWLDISLYRRYSASLDYVEECAFVRVSCYRKFAAKRMPAGSTWYLYVPRHYAQDVRLAEALGSDPAFARVHTSAFGTIFAATPGGKN